MAKGKYTRALMHVCLVTASFRARYAHYAGIARHPEDHSSSGPM
jgi:hypothetical protein